MRHAKRTIGSVVCCLVAIGCWAHVGAEPLRIGAWNIEHCGRQVDGKYSPKKDPTLMARYIKDSGASVIALSEMYITNDPSPGQKLENYWLKKVLAELSGDWDYTLFDKTCQRGQNLGVMFNKDIVSLKQGDRFFLLDLGKWYYSDYGKQILCRWPVATYFQVGTNKTDFLLVPIHLKSNTDGYERMRMHRAAEATHLLTAIDKLPPVAVKDRELDIYISGDTNMKYADEPAGKVFEARGYVDLNGDDQATHPAKGTYAAAAFDRHFVHSWSEEADHDSFHVCIPDDKPKFAEESSDHYLVTFEIDVRLDDD